MKKYEVVSKNERFEASDYEEAIEKVYNALDRRNVPPRIVTLEVEFRSDVYRESIVANGEEFLLHRSRYLIMQGNKTIGYAKDQDTALEVIENSITDTTYHVYEEIINPTIDKNLQWAWIIVDPETDIETRFVVYDLERKFEE